MRNAVMLHFEYDDIDTNQRRFRLLRLRKGKGRIECDLYPARLPDDNPLHDRASKSYEALSYTWGPVEISESISVNGKHFGVTENLYLALQHLRLDDCDRVIWIDAICINQNNKAERGHQVQQMGDIYQNARRVIFWLGAGTYETNVVMDSLKSLYEEGEVERYKDRKVTDQRWKNLWEKVKPPQLRQYPGLETLQRKGIKILYTRPWFKRVWILQEVAKVQDAIVCCGTRSIPARNFVLTPSLIGVKPEPHCQAVLDIMPGLYREDSRWEKRPSLYTLLVKFRGSEASDPRDMIYALLGISSDARHSGILSADYTKDTAHIIRDVTKFMFDLSYTRYNTMPGFLDHLTDLNEESIARVAESGNLAQMANLLDQPGDEMRVTQKIFEEAAKTWSGKMMEVFLLHKRNEEVKITEMVLKAAAGNIFTGKEVLKVLLLHRQRDEMNMTEEVLIRAAKNSSGGMEIISFLMENTNSAIYTQRVMEAAVQSQQKVQEVKAFFQRAEDKVKVTEEMLEAAASNPWIGKDLTKFFLSHQQMKGLKITRKIIRAASENSLSGRDVLSVLYLFSLSRGDHEKTTKKLLDALHSWKG